MDSTLVNEVSKLAVPLVASAILAGLKYAAPKVRDKVPNLLWPIAVFGLARLGSVVCDSAGVDCSGNPFNFSPETVQALSAAFVAIVIHQVGRASKDTFSKALGKAQELITKAQSAK